MPLLGLHMTAAREIASDLGAHVIDADRGAYYLGATTPDIRAMTRWDRERTHFFRLDDLGEQSGAHRMFEEQPRLRDPSRLDAATAAFVAGYVTHLVLDEQYICQIYRPFFGEDSAASDDPLANVIDRLLQFEMDKAGREQSAVIDEIRRDLEATSADITVDFIAREALRDWHRLQIEIITRPPSFVKMLGRHLHSAGIEGEQAVAGFIEQQADTLLRGTVARIGEDRIRAYLADSKQRALAQVKEYLS